LSDLAVLMELRRQLRLFQPWCLFWNNLEHRDEWSNFLRHSVGGVCVAIEKCFDQQSVPELRKFTTSTTSKTTARGTREHRKRQNELDDLYTQIEACARTAISSLGDQETTAVIDSVLQESASHIQRFKPVFQAAQEEHTSSTSTQPAPQAPATLDECAFGALSLDTSASAVTAATPSRFTTAPRKTKEKTVGSPATAQAPVVQAQEVPPAPARRQYALPQKHCDRMMLTLNAQQGSAPSELPLQDFLDMMVAVGFTGRRNTGVQINF